MGTGIITYRNQIWDAMIEFLSQLKEYPSFEVMDNGKLKARVEYIYNRALERMRLDKSDMDLISRTFIYLNEKEIDKDLVEYMNENKELGHKCTTTRDGEKIIKECEAIVKKRKADQVVREKYEEAKKKYEEAAAKRKAYEDEQNRIMGDYENSQRELMELEEVYKNIDSQGESTEEAKEIVNESVK